MIRILPLLIACFVAFLALPVCSMRCENTTIRHYVRCRDECTPFTDMTVTTLVDTCTKKQRFGCDLQLCAGGFQCMQDPDHPFPICANDKTIFNETAIDTGDKAKDPLKFLVDVNAPPLKVQYYFLIDTSKSMTPHLQTVKLKIIELMGMYKNMPDVDAKFALGEYRDPRFRGPNPITVNGQCGLRRISGFVSGVSGIQSDVNSLSAEPTGGSGPEGLLPSIVQATETSGWNSGARKIIIVFGDAPGFEKTKHDLFGRNPNVPSPLGREDVAQILQRTKIVLIGVSFGDIGLDGATYPWNFNPINSSPPPSDVGNPGQLSFIAQASGGVVTSPTKTLMQAVIEAKESYEREYTMDASDCESKGMVINNGEAFRVKLKPSTSSTVEMTMSLKGPFCDPFNCNIKYQEDGIDLIPLGLNFLKINGCPEITGI